MKTADEEVSEQASNTEVDLSFMDDDVEHVESSDGQQAVFKEPTEEQRPSDSVPQEHEGVIGTDFWNSEGDWAATVIGETPDGNKLQVMKRPDGVGYRIGWRNGGVVPPECEGWFTSYDKAEQAARTYLNKNWGSTDA